MRISYKSDMINLFSYNIYDEKFPQKINKDILHLSYWIRDALMEAEINTLHWAVVTHPSYWNCKPFSVNLFVFGSFYRFYPIINKLAKVLTPICIESRIIPILWPINLQQWRMHIEAKSHLCKKLSCKGLLIYSKEEINATSR